MMNEYLWLADATSDAVVPPWLQGGGFVTLLSLVCWWVWHNTAVAIPKIHAEQRDHMQKKDEEHRSHVEAIVSDHKETTTTLLSEFRSEIKEQRATCAQEKQMLFDQLHGKRQPRAAT